MLADANEARDWRIYAEFAQHLIRIARRLYANEAFGVDLKETVYALDATTIDLCLTLFPWAPFRTTKAASSCIPCSTRAATSRVSSTSPMASFMASISWTNCCPSPAPSTSWNSIYETLQILSLTMFETTPLHQLLSLDPPDPFSPNGFSPLNLLQIA